MNSYNERGHENQERTFDNYILSRYGSLDAAWAHWKSFGGY